MFIEIPAVLQHAAIYLPYIIATKKILNNIQISIGNHMNSSAIWK